MNNTCEECNKKFALFEPDHLVVNIRREATDVSLNLCFCDLYCLGQWAATHHTLLITSSNKRVADK